LHGAACDAKGAVQVKSEPVILGRRRCILRSVRTRALTRTMSLTVGLVATAVPAHAQETGLAGMHEWVRIGGRTCLLDHYHDGSGSGPTRAAAMRAAIGAWSDFTAFELQCCCRQAHEVLGRTRQLQLRHLRASLPLLTTGGQVSASRLLAMSLRGI
jgi:hypothetical protein